MTEDDLRELKAEVRKLADIEEIKQLRARYTRWIDTKDWDALKGELTEDFHADTERGVLDGREAFIGSLSQSLSAATTAHHCHTPEIEITGPGTATGVWAMQDHVSMTHKGAPLRFRGAGHYHDTYVRTGSGWRIASTALKRLSVDPLTTNPSCDRVAIAEQFNRFADALDRKEWSLLNDFFTEDAVGEFRARDPRMEPIRIRGREGLIDFARRMIGSPEIVTQHLLGNLSASVEGDAAEARVRMRGYHAGLGRREGLFEESIGHYAGRFERTDAGWRCSRWEEEIYLMLGDPALFAPEVGGS